MTVFKSTDGLVVGQPISPFFGAQNGIQGAGAPVIPSPAASPNSGPQVTALASVANGSLPMNANVTLVNGVATGAIAGIGGDNASVAEMLSSGNGAPSYNGVAIPGSAGNPVGNGAINNQIFVDGITTTNAALSTGPVSTDVSTLTQAPMTGATVVSNVSTSGFQG
jgi:hypothetical protein